MNSMGVTLDTCGIAEVATVVEALSNSVLHANLDAFADGDVVELMQRLETCKRQLSALDSRLIIEACDRSLPKGSAAKDVVPFLRQTLGLSRYDRVGAGEDRPAVRGILRAHRAPASGHPRQDRRSL
ncbi:hypothetical protein ACWEP5_10990 [Nocardia niigatensis]